MSTRRVRSRGGAAPLTEKLRNAILRDIKRTKKTSQQLATKHNVSVPQVAALRAHLTMGTY